MKTAKADPAATVAVVTLTTCLDDGLLLFSVHRTIDLAKSNADNRIERDRFATVTSDWKSYGRTVGGTRSYTREISYDMPSGPKTGWQAIEEISEYALDKEAQ